MMSGRPIVSYDDITLPYDQPAGPSHNVPSSSSSHPGHADPPPPAKKRKRNNNQKGKRRENANSQSAEFQKHLNNNLNHHHKMGTSSQPQPQQKYEAEGEAVDGTEGEYAYEYEFEEEEEEGEGEESRELTHQEIWDDSALVDAWEAAMEEYEAFHGPEKDWKKEPVKKSPLWYNVPIDPSKKQTKTVSPTPAISTYPATGDGTETDSKPLDFNTFVPTHDPSLDTPLIPSIPPVPTTATAITTTTSGDAIPGSTSYIPDSFGHPVSQDEAFQRAMSAMYWGGYWTAMYHSQRQLSQMQPPKAGPSMTAHEVLGTGTEEEQGETQEHGYEGEEFEVDDDDDEGGGEGEGEEEDEFVSTQR